MPPAKTPLPFPFESVGRGFTMETRLLAGFVPPPEESPRLSGYQRRRKKDIRRPLSARVPDLYRDAHHYRWESVEAGLRIYPEQAKYVHDDGTTALHLAVTSRTGFKMEGRDKEKRRRAPLELIEELVKAYPEAAKARCQQHSYTPMAYACLVVVSECDLIDMDAMVRIILKYCPESTMMFTDMGLSPVDVHIVSYSQKMTGRVEEESLSGRTSTILLRTLLENNPALAEVRIIKDKVIGPIEILYRSNKAAFLEAVDADDIKKATKERSTERRSLSSKSVITQVTSWWVWGWIILILKYGILKYKKRGARFLAVHAVAGIVGCPIPVLTLVMNAFPKQIRERDEMNQAHGNLPMHEVCSWPCFVDCTSTDPVISSRKGMAIAALLQEYPDAAKTCNRHGETPLDLAVSTGTTWDIGVRKLVRAYPQAVSIQNLSTRLYPFMTAAVSAGESPRKQEPLPTSKRTLKTHLKNLAKQDLQSTRTIYGLLRANPMVLIRCVQEEEAWSMFSSGNSVASVSESFWASSHMDRTTDWGDLKP